MKQSQNVCEKLLIFESLEETPEVLTKTMGRFY